MSKNKKQIMALILSGLMAFNGSFPVTAAELENGPEVATVEATEAATEEKVYDVKDLAVVTRWGTELTENEDGSVTIDFPKQYNQVFFSFPDGINSTNIEKIIVAVDSNDQFSLKFCNTADLQQDFGAVYGTNVITRETIGKQPSLKDANGFGMMSLLDGELQKTVTTVTFVINDKEEADEPVVDEPVAEEQESIKTVAMTDLKQIADWGGNPTANEDGSITYSFAKQYGQTFYEYPAGVDASRLEKIEVNADSNESLSLKFCDKNDLSKDYGAVYGTNVITSANVAEGTSFAETNGFGIMSLKAVAEDEDPFQKTIYTVTFYLGEKKAETGSDTPVSQPTEVTYKFTDLTPAYTWGAELTNNEDGSITVDFGAQYNQFGYLLPEGVDAERLQSVVVDATESGRLSLKFMADTENQDEAAVIYGGSSISVDKLTDGYSASDIKAVTLMGLDEGYSTTLKTITFKMSAPAAKDQTIKLSDLEMVGKSEEVVLTENENGSVTIQYPGQYQKVCYKIPEDVNPATLESISVTVSDASQFSIKLMATVDDALENDEKEMAVVYGNSTISFNSIKDGFTAADAQSFILMSLAENFTTTASEVKFNVRKQETNEQGLAIYSKEAYNNNPIVTQRYGADPSAMVYDDTVYIYTTNDIYEYQGNKVVKNTYGKVKQINCYSSKDLVNWTDHGPIDVAGKGNEVGAAKWASNSWAPCAAHKTIDGKEKFFLYFADNGSGIGVLTSDSPTGPWVDPLGTQLISRKTPTCADITWLFDPAVMIDDDGTGYLVFGGGVPSGKEANPQNARVVKLGDDMISLANDPVMIDAPWLFEDSGLNKIGDTYYYSYCTNWNGGPYGNASIAYMTSKDPMGPYEFQGVFFRNPRGGKDGGNNHHSLFEFNGKYYLAYHTAEVAIGVFGENLDYRSTSIDEVTIVDGVIKEVASTQQGVSQLTKVDPYAVNQAETIGREYGVATEKVDNAGNAVVVANEGDWTEVKGVDFAYGVSEMTVTAAAKDEAKIEIRTGSAEGTLIGTVNVDATGDEFKEFTVKTLNVTGERNLFFVFKGDVKMDTWQAKTATIFTFDQLTKAQSYNLTETVNEDGSLSVSYEKQWAEIRYEIPDSIDASAITGVTVVTKSGDTGKLAVKLLSSIDPATEDVVAYGSNALSCAAGTAEASAYVGIMNMNEGAADYEFSSIIFTVETAKDKGEKGNEVETDIPDLKEAVQAQTDDDFIVGAAIMASELTDKKLMQIVTKHFNAVTFGNELKPDANFGYASKCPGTETVVLNGEELVVPKLNMSRGENMCNWILEWNKANPDNPLKIRGHVLVWHSQTPEWFFHEDYDASKPYVTADEMTKRQEWYIKSVLEHFVGEDSPYKDLFYGWDVVNEAVSDGTGTYRNGNENSTWWKVYGNQDFIINAFRFANKYAPASLELYYNDYNETVTSKVKGICQLLTDVKNAEGTRIDGMGMQGHYQTAGSPSAGEFKTAARQYAAIVGKVTLTELDFKCSNEYDGTKATQAAEDTRTAYRYAEIFNAVKELREEEGINFANITVWGVIDKNSWLQTSNSAGGGANGNRRQCPLLFDDYYQAKPAYWALVDQSKLEPEIKSINITGAADATDTYVKEVGDVELTAAGATAKIDITWKAAQIQAIAYVSDESEDAKDSITMYINANGKTSQVTATRKDSWEGVEGGYTVDLLITAEELGLDQFTVGQEIKIDFVFVNGSKKAAFNDYTFSQDRSDEYLAKAILKPFMEVVKGTAVIDGELDEAWESIREEALAINLGSKASATARLMWDEENLYVYVDVKDSVLNSASSNEHEKDSVEIFIDENNHKSDSYEADDKQYRINYLNKQSFNGTKCTADNIVSAVKVTETGYVLETAIAWTDITPVNGQMIGLELQINDADKSGSRIGTLNWFDTTGNGWSSPAVFGTVKLAMAEVVSNDKIVTSEDGTMKVVIDGEVVEKEGVYEINGQIYYVNNEGNVQTETKYISKKLLEGTGLEAGYYHFNLDGSMVVSTGVVNFEESYDEDGNIEYSEKRYYIENGLVQKNAGLVEADGKLYVVNWDGSVYMGDRFFTVKANAAYGIEAGKYFFNALGEMYVGQGTDCKEFNGVKYLLDGGKLLENVGLVMVGTDYYYAQYDGQAVINKTYKVSKCYNVEAGTVTGKHHFGEDGKMDN